MISSSVQALASLKGLQMLGAGIKNTISSVTNMASHFESVKTGLATILQDAQKGEEVFEKLRKLSFDTTFGVDELASATTQLLNVGVALDDIQPKLLMLGDLAGGSKAKFQSFVDIYSKVIGTGTASSRFLQSFTLQGIPITKELQKMGIQGTASADQLTEAFQRLTGEGGQFHNAMNNIIETIEGKKGFIEDTMKEILVNFGEATGLTDAYKVALDVIYSVLDKINNALSWISDHPFAKAILSGALVGAITAIGTTLTLMLVAKLKTISLQLTKLIGQYTILNALKGATGWITLGVAGATALAVGMSDLAKKTQEASDAQKELTDRMKETGQVAEQLIALQKNGNDVSNGLNTSTQDQIKANEETIAFNDNIISQYKQMQESFEDYLKKRYSMAVSQGNVGTFRTFDEYRKSFGTEDFNKYLKRKGFFKDNDIEYSDAFSIDELEKFNNAVKESTESLKENTQQQNLFDGKSANAYVTNLLKPYIETVNELYNEKDSVVKKLLSATDAKGNYLNDTDENYRKMVTAVEKSYSDKINLTNRNGEIQTTSYMANLQNILGISTKEDLKNNKILNSSRESLNYYVNKIIDENTLLNKFGKGVDENELNSQIYDDLVKKYIQFKNTGDFGTDADLWKAFDSLLEKYKPKVDELAEETTKVTTAFQDLQNQLRQSLYSLGEYGQFLQLYDSKQSEYDAYNEEHGLTEGMEGFKSIGSNDIYSMIGQILLQTVLEVCQSLDNFQYAFNPIKNALIQLKPVLQIVIDVLAIVNSIISSIVKILMKFLNWGDWMGKLHDYLSGYIDDLYDVSDATSDLTSEYESLLKSMRENEEYYIKQKKIINSDTYADKAYKVNDMILTPNGTFSTSPQDTILAMKHPEDLVGGSVKMNVNIQNNASNDVSVSAQQITNEKGLNELLVTISKKVASDVAGGKNGWDSALLYRQQRVEGRSIQG